MKSFYGRKLGVVVGVWTAAAGLAGCMQNVGTSGKPMDVTIYNRLIAQGTAHRVPTANCPAVPKLVSGQIPIYPPDMLSRRQTGDVRVILDIGNDGIPSNIRIESATDPQFAAAVMAVVPQWRFASTSTLLVPMQHCWVRLPFPFTLNRRR